MSPQSFWDELKRRNVVRVGAFYAGASWLLVQVATQVFPFFDVPNGTVRLVVLGAVAGLPLALVLSWFYELTPEGLKRESEMAADTSIPRSSGRRLDRSIIAVLSLAVVVLLAGLVLQRKSGSPPSKARADADKSVAVLPFQNLSDDKSNAYFAQGIQDEILTRLAKIGALRVISRSSTASLASAPDDLPEVARRLGVENFLEGSVQKVGDQVHINVQLIRAMSNDHIWAETYDRKLDNVFGVEGEVAQAIAEALEARLSGAEHRSMQEAPTRNAQAYDDYLKGLNAELSYHTSHDILDAAHYFDLAVQADPQFALAWAHLSIAHSLIYSNAYDHSAARLELMRRAAETAMRLQPTLGEAWLARGYYFYRGRADYTAALADFGKAWELLPNSGEVDAAIAYVKRRQGDFDAALQNLTGATRKDPRNTSYWEGISEIHDATRRYGQAQAALDRAIEISPDNLSLRAQKIDDYLHAGDLEAAQKHLDELPADAPSAIIATQRSSVQLFQHRYAALAANLKALFDADGEAEIARELPDADRIPDLYSLMGAGQLLSGDPAGAKVSLEAGRSKALAERDSGTDTAELAGALGMIDALLGRSEEALTEGQRGIDLAGSDALEKPQAEVSLVRIEALLGEADLVFAQLPGLTTVAYGVSPGDLRYSPVWDKVRTDPRFAKALASVAAATSP